MKDLGGRRELRGGGSVSVETGRTVADNGPGRAIGGRIGVP